MCVDIIRHLWVVGTNNLWHNNSIQNGHKALTRRYKSTLSRIANGHANAAAVQYVLLSMERKFAESTQRPSESISIEI